MQESPKITQEQIRGAIKQITAPQVKPLESFGVKVPPAPRHGRKSENGDLIERFIKGYERGFTAALEIRGDIIYQRTKKGNWFPLLKKYQDKVALSNNYYNGLDVSEKSYREVVEEKFDKAGWIVIAFNLENLKFIDSSDTKIMMLEQLIYEASNSLQMYQADDSHLNKQEQARDNVLKLLCEAAKGKGDYQGVRISLQGKIKEIDQSGPGKIRSQVKICRAFIRQLEQERDIETFRRLAALPSKLYPSTIMRRVATSELTFEAIKIKQKVEIILAQVDSYIDVLKTIARAHEYNSRY